MVVCVQMPATQGNMATVSLTLPDGDDVSRHMCQRSFALPCKGMHVDSVPLLTVTRMVSRTYSVLLAYCQLLCTFTIYCNAVSALFYNRGTLYVLGTKPLQYNGEA